MIDVLESIYQDVAAGRLSKAAAVERFKGLAIAAKQQRMSLGWTGWRFAAAHAPKGGVTINGVKYTGGEFIPASEMGRASAAEVRKFEAKGGKIERTHKQETMFGDDEDATPTKQEAHDPVEAAKAEWKTHGTRSKAFKSWFGDWENDPENASKVVNEDGEPQETHGIPGTGSKVKGKDGKPITVYHGTARGGFDAFDKAKISKDNLFGPGFYFTEDKTVADAYTKKDEAPGLEFAKELSKQDAITMLNSLRKAKYQEEARDILNDYVLEFDDNESRDSLSKKLLPHLALAFHQPADDPYLRKAMDEANIELKQSDDEAETKAVYLNVRKPFSMDDVVDRKELERIEAAVDKANPGYNTTPWSLNRPKGEEVWKQVVSRFSLYFSGKENVAKAKANELLASLGYDGITHIGGDRMGGGHHHRVWIAFEPNQIKATDNQGTFDPSTPHMRMSIADYPGETYQTQTYDDLLDAIAQAGLAGAQMVIDDIREKLANRLFLHFSQGLTEETIAEARAIIAESEPLLAGTLSDTLIAAWIIGMDSVVRQIPDDVANEIWPMPTTDYMNEGPPGEPPFDAYSVLFPEDDGGARVRFPAIDEAVANLANRRVLRKAEFEQLSAEARKDAFTVAGQDSVETIGRIRDLVTDLVEQGPSLEEFNARLDSVLTDSKAPMNPWHRETVYRTNVQSAYSQGQDRVNADPMVADEFPYIMDASIHDTRRSEVCAWFAVNGVEGSNIYRADDKRYREYSPPRHFGCRSNRVWLSIKDAAARGIREAQAWLDTGLPPIPYRMPEPPPGVLKRMFAGQTAVAMSLAFDEAKVKRDHGKFSSKPGAKGKAAKKSITPGSSPDDRRRDSVWLARRLQQFAEGLQNASTEREQAGHVKRIALAVDRLKGRLDRTKGMRNIQAHVDGLKEAVQKSFTAKRALIRATAEHRNMLLYPRRFSEQQVRDADDAIDAAKSDWKDARGEAENAFRDFADAVAELDRSMTGDDHFKTDVRGSDAAKYDVDPTGKAGRLLGADQQSEEEKKNAPDSSRVHPAVRAMMRRIFAGEIVPEEEQRAIYAAAEQRRMSMLWDEAEHPRDHGKFASKPGAKGKQKTVSDFTEKDRKAVAKANKSEAPESKTPLFFDEENPLLAEKKPAHEPVKKEDEFGKYIAYGDAVDPDGNWKRLEKLPNDQHVALYHATSRDNAKKIIEHGYNATQSAFTDTPPDYVYMGGADGLGTYIGHQGKGDPVMVVFRVLKGDLEPDKGSDWKSHVRNFKSSIERHHGKESLKNPSPAVTYAAINQVRAHQSTVEPIGILDPEGNTGHNPTSWKFVPKSDLVQAKTEKLSPEEVIRKRRAKENPLASSLDAAEREARLRPKFTGPDDFTLNADEPTKPKPAMQGRLFSLPVRMDRAGQWITIGANKEAPKGEKGGTPVYLQNGKIVKGPPSLHGRKIANLKEEPGDQRTHRKQLADSSAYAKARRRKECREAGVDPKAVEQVGQELRQHDKEQVDQHNALIAHAEKLMGLSRSNKAFKGGDVHTLTKQGRRVDEVAGELSNSGQFAHLFNDSEPPGDQLFAYLEQGRRQYKSDDRIFNAALEFAVEHGLRPKNKEALEPVPFSLRMSLAGWRFSAVHAPKGGVTINGVDYVGGEFIPGNEMAGASDAELKAFEAKGGKATLTHEDATDDSPGDDIEAARKEWKEKGTRSKAFKSWFGDWENDPENASVVVDDDGTPKETYEVKKLYHGTTANFDAFDKEKIGENGAVVGKGFYFTDNEDLAKMYSQGSKGQILSCYLNIRKPFDFSGFIAKSELAQLAAIAQKKFPNHFKPAMFEEQIAAMRKWENSPDGSLSRYSAWMAMKECVRESRVNAILADAGYDGILHESRDEAGTPRSPKNKTSYGNVWIAFEPTQVKSADNQGTFDPSNPRIRMSMFDENKHPRADDGKFSAGQGGTDLAAVVKQSTEGWREDATPKVEDLAGMDDDDAAEAAEAWKDEIYDAVMAMDESVIKAFDDRFDSDERLTIDDAAETYWTTVHDLIDEFIDGDREDEDAQVALLDAIDDAGSAFVSEVELAVRNAQWMEEQEAEGDDEDDEEEPEEDDDAPKQQGHLFSRRMSDDEPWEIVGEAI